MALKKHLLDPSILVSIPSRAFWLGVAAGFSAPRYLCPRPRTTNLETLLGEKDSVYQAWLDVSGLIEAAFGEFEHDQTPFAELESEHGQASPESAGAKSEFREGRASASE
jgi:hypothetical protein